MSGDFEPFLSRSIPIAPKVGQLTFQVPYVYLAKFGFIYSIKWSFFKDGEKYVAIFFQCGQRNTFRAKNN